MSDFNGPYWGIRLLGWSDLGEYPRERLRKKVSGTSEKGSNDLLRNRWIKQTVRLSAGHRADDVQGHFSGNDGIGQFGVRRLM